MRANTVSPDMTQPRSTLKRSHPIEKIRKAKEKAEDHSREECTSTPVGEREVISPCQSPIPVVERKVKRPCQSTRPEGGDDSIEETSTPSLKRDKLICQCTEFNQEYKLINPQKSNWQAYSEATKNELKKNSTVLVNVVSGGATSTAMNLVYPGIGTVAELTSFLGGMAIGTFGYNTIINIHETKKDLEKSAENIQLIDMSETEGMLLSKTNKNEKQDKLIGFANKIFEYLCEHIIVTKKSHNLMIDLNKLKEEYKGILIELVKAMYNIHELAINTKQVDKIKNNHKYQLLIVATLCFTKNRIASEVFPKEALESIPLSAVRKQAQEENVLLYLKNPDENNKHIYFTTFQEEKRTTPIKRKRADGVIPQEKKQIKTDVYKQILDTLSITNT
jgi:phage terminase Nu1 subunit (DNA packaging protein)